MLMPALYLLNKRQYCAAKHFIFRPVTLTYAARGFLVYGLPYMVYLLITAFFHPESQLTGEGGAPPLLGIENATSALQ